jgi:hypothetical protein
MAFTGAIKQSGHARAGEPLEPTDTATSVRVRDGKRLRTDAPFGGARLPSRPRAAQNEPERRFFTQRLAELDAQLAGGHD